MAQTGLGREQTFFKIMFFFILITAITGILNLANTGAITLGDIGSSSYGQTLPGQTVPDISVRESTTSSESGGDVVGNQDFTTASGYDSNITQVSTSILSGDMWLRSNGVGYESTYTPASWPQLAFINFRGAQSTNGVYDVTYHVYNQFGSSPFYTLVSGSETGSGFVSGFYVKYDTNSISVVHDADISNPLSTISYPGASNGQTIQTQYNPSAGTVNVIIDGNYAGQFTNLNFNGQQAGVAQYQAGIAASHYGLQVNGVDGTFKKEKTFDFFSDLFDKINALVVFGSQFLSLVASMLGLTQNPFVPFWLWAIIALPCIATLILIYIEIARGD
jgi:hypothetical protein